MNPVEKAQSEQPSGNKRKSGRFQKGNKLGHRFQPGESGNPSGRPKKLPITLIFEELFENSADRAAIKKQVRNTLTRRGMAGVLLLREAAERIEGKVVQPVEAEVNVKLTLEQVLEAKKKAGK